MLGTIVILILSQLPLAFFAGWVLSVCFNWFFAPTFHVSPVAPIMGFTWVVTLAFMCKSPRDFVLSYIEGYWTWYFLDWIKYFVLLVFATILAAVIGV